MIFRQLFSSLREPEFWAYSSWLDIVTKYRRSRLGLLWLLIPPIIYIFGVGYYFAKLQGVSPLGFIPHMGVGYLLFRFLMTTIMESASILPGNASFILDGHVRLTDFVMRVLAKGLFYLIVSLPILVVVLVLAPQLEPLGLLTMVPAMILLVTNALWMGIIVSLLGARFPDINELMSSLFIFGFILTPILWTAAAAPVGTAHGMFMRANPFFHMIEIVRAPLLGEPIEPFTYAFMAVLTVAGWALTAFVYKRYARFVPLWV
jgi:ABC-2 type transport system permease protein/lipopolysaccharide transport system permease protein